LECQLIEDGQELNFLGSVVEEPTAYHKALIRFYAQELAKLHRFIQAWNAKGASPQSRRALFDKLDALKTRRLLQGLQCQLDQTKPTAIFTFEVSKEQPGRRKSDRDVSRPHDSKPSWLRRHLLVMGIGSIAALAIIVTVALLVAGVIPPLAFLGAGTAAIGSVITALFLVSCIVTAALALSVFTTDGRQFFKNILSSNKARLTLGVGIGVWLLLMLTIGFGVFSLSLPSMFIVGLGFAVGATLISLAIEHILFDWILFGQLAKRQDIREHINADHTYSGVLAVLTCLGNHTFGYKNFEVAESVSGAILLSFFDIARGKKAGKTAEQVFACRTQEAEDQVSQLA